VSDRDIDMLLEIAHQQVGHSADPADPSSRDHFLNLIGYGEPKYKQDAMASSMSTCGLVAAGILWMWGIRSRRISPPYRSTTAISRMYALGADSNALRWPKVLNGEIVEWPEGGDILLIGDNGLGGSEHMYMSMEVKPEQGEIISVDGGQKNVRGHQAVHRRHRRWSVRDGRVIDQVFRNDTTGSTTLGSPRVVQWWIKPLLL